MELATKRCAYCGFGYLSGGKVLPNKEPWRKHGYCSEKCEEKHSKLKKEATK